MHTQPARRRIATLSIFAPSPLCLKHASRSLEVKDLPNGTRKARQNVLPIQRIPDIQRLHRPVSPIDLDRPRTRIPHPNQPNPEVQPHPRLVSHFPKTVGRRFDFHHKVWDYLRVPAHPYPWRQRIGGEERQVRLPDSIRILLQSNAGVRTHQPPKLAGLDEPAQQNRPVYNYLAVFYSC